SLYDWETRYAGYRWDAECGLYHVRNRGYHPVLGQFLRRDPVGWQGTERSLYQYVMSNPVRWVDPAGLFVPPAPIQDVAPKLAAAAVPVAPAAAATGVTAAGVATVAGVGVAVVGAGFAVYKIGEGTWYAGQWAYIEYEGLQLEIARQAALAKSADAAARL